MPYEPFDHAAVAQHFGVSRLPHPLNLEDLTQSLRRHYPSELRELGTRGRVLLSLNLDASGSVMMAQAVDPPSSSQGGAVKAVLVNPAGREHEVATSSVPHPALKLAAEAAALVLRFTPAERHGQAVPFSGYRLSVDLAPPPAA